MLDPYSCNWEGLRASDDITLLHEKETKSVTFGDRALSIYGQKMWNNLTQDICTCNSVESFKKNLKIHLFAVLVITIYMYIWTNAEFRILICWWYAICINILLICICIIICSSVIIMTNVSRSTGSTSSLSDIHRACYSSSCYAMR